MTIEEAIKTAIEFETQVRQVYRDAAEGASDPVGKRIFKVLAQEEQGHLEYLQSKLDEWKKSGTLTAERLDTVLPSRERISKGISTLEARRPGDERGGELQMLSRALDVEAKTSDFYKRMVKELPQEGKQLFAHFVEIEEGHLAIVRAEIDYLSKTGYWFDFKEFDME
ncbi:MAG TPA: ferritin family protein [Desulfatiglandales bacterium]|nr:ferritin family protein [Desulfatiglandales bacterium]